MGGGGEMTPLSRRHTWPGVTGAAIAIFAADIGDKNSPAFAKCARSRDFVRSSL